ncbi:MAG TPA: type IV secretion protein Rhs [Cyanobacteria bacterium UBA8543]|nr:type IV secretion protein Rhs [Cyanobacteria bacterium UBA8543]
MNQFCNAFISYGRADSKAFAIKLHARLLEQGLKIWFDQNDIPLGVDFQNQIDDGIEKAHNFLFLIAPHSVNSPYCGKEIELALKRKKRIIPLLHVEQITQETWQQRNPKGTPEEWEAYKQKGLHSSFPNMHPAIGKINWVYFREGIDDFETSFTGLINLLCSHADYVEHHTQFLVKALEWERHQKQRSWLLIADEKQQAEAWLNRRFKNEQPPCVPSDLHCEYITESIKNANNLMTQVIISYANEDRATMEKIRNSLRQESITVWTNTTDIQTGEVLEEAIKRGIEQADNVVYLLSPDSVKSDFARQELDYALSLNKRIIPVLVREILSEPIPNALRDLQYIDLTDNVKEEDYHLDESELLRILHQDEAYYNEHKVLLTKALKWKRQHENSNILLRGYNLRSAETWLKVANKRALHPPTPLIEEFIAESLRQPPAISLDVFISYSRADSDFARKLNDELQLQGKRTWFDQESIASGADFAQEICQGIQACDNFLFILSPRSVNSPYCAEEVEYAAQLNKRFVTLLHRSVNSDELHPELGKVQWIDFNQNERDFQTNFRQLVRMLDTDREHLRHHTKWSQRAIEWQEKNHSADLLLRGSEFLIAQSWLQESEQQKKQPVATALQKEFILESGEAIATALKKEKRQVIILRSLLGVMSVAFVTVAGLGWRVYQREKEAKQLLKGQVNALTRYTETLIDSNQEFDALIEGIRAGTRLLEQPDKRELDLRKRVEKALRAALNDRKELNRLGGRNTTVSVSPDNETIATASKDGAVKLWNFQGKTFKTLPHKAEVTEIVFSPDDGKTIATLSEDKTVKLWNKDGKELGHLPEQAVSFVRMSPDGKLIATHSGDSNNRTVNIWKLNGEKLNRINPFPSGEKFNGLIFSHDGKLIATYRGDSESGTFKLWRLDGEKLNHFYSFPSSEKFYNLQFSRNGKLIATRSGGDNTGKLWSIEGKQLKHLLPNETFNYLEFSPDSKLIATFSGDRDNKTVKLWSDEGKQLKPLFPNETFNYLEFSPDSKLIATFSGDRHNKTVKLWNLNSKEPKILSRNAENEKVWFSPDSKIIATANRDNTVQLWNPEGDELQTFHPGTSFYWVLFSPEGDAIATVSSDYKVRLWSFDSKKRTVLSDADTPVNHVSFSPDGKLIASYSGSGKNRIINLRSIEGKQLNRLLPSEKFDELVLGLDGKLIATYSSGGNQTGKLWSIEGTQLKRLLPNEKFDVLEFNPNSKLIATHSFGSNQTGKLWSIEGKQLKRFLPNETFNAVSLDNPNGKLIATSNKDENNSIVKLWSADGKQLKHFTANEKFDALDLSPDGRLIATYNLSGSNRTVKFWSVDGKPIELFPPDEKFIFLQFSPDGKLIATFSGGNWNDLTVKFWKLEDQKPRYLTTVSNVPGDNVKFSPDNKTIATAIGNNSVKLWSQDGKELATLKLNNSINNLSFSPNGKILAIATADKKVSVWHLNLNQWMIQSHKGLEELVEQACQKVGNYLQDSAPESDRTLCDDIERHKR